MIKKAIASLGIVVLLGVTTYQSPIPGSQLTTNTIKETTDPIHPPHTIPGDPIHPPHIIVNI
ncbi:hypothetical protein QTG56_01530 [Rossellomorea sp. AcN35-11]|nr:hypothetical protein [Rossellomorea aquimaris]WJV29876.1 hypothetical protein QTG56_01530 [Rossellomorea sp. AcN35-11]